MLYQQHPGGDFELAGPRENEIVEEKEKKLQREVGNSFNESALSMFPTR